VTAPVTYRREGAVGTITIDKPPLNAYDAPLEAGLREAWRTARDDDEAVVVLLRAEGKHFCGGADLTAPHAGVHPDPVALYRLQQSLTKPTIAAVQGGCVGGGLRWVWPCDLILTSEDAFFRDPTVRFGLGGIQAHGHTWEYGPRLAKEMLFTGGRLPAARLAQAGLVNRVTSRERLPTEAAELAAEIAGMPPLALRKAKLAVDSALDVMGRHTIVSRFAEMMIYQDVDGIHAGPT
jgi:enoyl-CoA hydratase